MSESESLERLEAKLQTLTTIATIAIFFLIYTYITGQKHQRQVLQKVSSRHGSAASALKPSPVLKASDFVNDGKHHLLLAATGSVATIKIPNMLRELAKYRGKVSVRLLLTESAAEFLGGQTDEQPSLEAISRMSIVDGIYLDRDEWLVPWTRGAPILHIELRRWADLMLIAPLSANSLAKLCLGLSDDLVSSVVRAWDTTGLIDGKRKTVLLAPAMNTAMWEHPVTKAYVRQLQGQWSVKNGGWMEVIMPVQKDLACGDVGGGAMREWKEIVGIVEEKMGLK